MIGLPEVLIILVIALLILGPKRLPKLARSMGKAVKEYKKAADEVETRSRSVKKGITKAADVIDDKAASGTKAAESK